jgi:hypothetical protein
MYLFAVRIAILGLGLPKSISAQQIHFAMATEKRGGMEGKGTKKKTAVKTSRQSKRQKKRQRHKGSIYNSNKYT